MRAFSKRPLQTKRQIAATSHTGTRGISTQSTSTSYSITQDYAPHLDSRYIARYRDPARHDLPPVVRKTWRNNSSNASAVGNISSSPGIQTTSYARTSHDAPCTMRGTRLEMGRSRTGPRSQPSPRASTGSSDSRRTPKKTALLFPGSGSQYVGMNDFLKDFKASQETWDEAEDALASFEQWRKDLKLHELPELQHLDLLNWPTWQKERSEKELRQIVRKGPQDELTRSSNSQPAICITSIALLRTLEREFGIPISTSASHFAGHSSGEYSACVAAGVLTFAEGVKLTRLHGLLTSRTLQLSSLKSYSSYDATDEERAQMSAIVLQNGHSYGDVEKLVKEIRDSSDDNRGMVEVAAYNSSTQIILTGSRAGVLRACEKLEDKHIAARAADLPVFANFHANSMQRAAIGMRHAWDHGVAANAPRRPIVSNLDAGLITTAERLKSDIVASIYKPVLWAPAMEVMREAGVDRYVFIGPGKALANLARKEAKTGRWKSWKEVEIASVATLRDLEEAKELCSDLIQLEASKGSD